MSRITQKGATSPLSLQANGSFQSSSDANLGSLVGSRFDLSDGREVILVGVGAVAISTAGLLLQDAAIVANHQNLSVTSFTAYSNNGNVPASVLVTLGATALSPNQYQGGFAVVNSGPGIGQTLRIASHAAVAASGTVSIVLEDAPNTALTSSSKVCLLPPHGGNVVVFPTTATGAAVGVSLYPLSAGTAATVSSSFGFALSKGNCSVLSDAAVASVGQSISPSVATAGAVTISGGTGAVVGYAAQTAVSGEARCAFIDL